MTGWAAASVRAEIAGAGEELAAITARLVRIPSENPPGRSYSECAQELVRVLGEAGLDAEVIAGDVAGDGTARPIVRAFVGEGPTLWFHGHYDVVPAQDPRQFEPAVRDRRLYGRGSADMKGGLAALIVAARAIQSGGGPLAGRLGLVFVPDEETGGAGGSSFLRRAGLLQGGTGMLSPEPTGGVAWNACRGAISLRVTVHGRGAHVGLSHQADNAFERMLDVAGALRTLEAEVAGRRTAHALEPEAAQRSILLLGGEASSGGNFNVVPDRCTFTVDRRLNPEEDLDAERARLLELFERLRAEGHRLEVEVLQDEPPADIDPVTPVGAALARAVAEVEGRELRFELCPGLLEIRFYAAEGIPAYCYGPGRLEVAHGPDEQVDLDALRRCCEVYALAALDVLGPRR